MTRSSEETASAIRRQLAGVLDPELRRDLVSLGMIEAVDVREDGASARIVLKLTIAGCPKKSHLTEAVREAAEREVSSAEVELTVMTPEERDALTREVKGPERRIPFAEPDSLTRVITVASGKGGVGKSTVTANLSFALAARGLSVGVVDADIHGFSIPPLMGVSEGPTKVGELMMPPRVADVPVMSIGMFVGSDQPVSWRGPMLHRAVEQFLRDTWFGDLDILLLDLPPGTGDVAITVSQLLPSSSMLVVTTPQADASAVAERAGVLAAQTGHEVLGVVENMSWIEAGGQRLTPFGEGGGQMLADRLTARLSESQPSGVPLLAQIPLRDGVRDLPQRHGHDDAFAGLAERLAARPRGLQGKPLGVSPAR